MKALKALVIFLGVLILAGFVTLAVGLYYKAGSIDESPATVTAAAGGDAAFGTVTVPMGDCEIARTHVAAGRLFLELGPATQRACRRVVVVNATTGAHLGTVMGGPDGVDTGAAPAVPSAQ